jgi:hypothetical protein
MYQYKIVSEYESYEEEQERKLNQLAADGWRVCKTWARYTGIHTTRYYLMERERNG